jgi:hypothetical protein
MHLAAVICARRKSCDLLSALSVSGFVLGVSAVGPIVRNRTTRVGVRKSMLYINGLQRSKSYAYGFLTAIRHSRWAPPPRCVLPFDSRQQFGRALSRFKPNRANSGAKLTHHTTPVTAPPLRLCVITPSPTANRFNPITYFTLARFLQHEIHLTQGGAVLRFCQNRRMELPPFLAGKLLSFYRIFAP